MIEWKRRSFLFLHVANRLKFARDTFIAIIARSRVEFKVLPFRFQTVCSVQNKFLHFTVHVLCQSYVNRLNRQWHAVWPWSLGLQFKFKTFVVFGLAFSLQYNILELEPTPDRLFLLIKIIKKLPGFAEITLFPIAQSFRTGKNGKLRERIIAMLCLFHLHLSILPKSALKKLGYSYVRWGSQK